MISTVYRLTAPGMIEAACQELDLTCGQVLLRPRYLSVCKADQRYYQGNRSPEVLLEKLPMALVHECCAEVIRDPSGQFQPGDMVIPCPNLPSEQDEFVAENYLPSSAFRSSGHDGFLQEYLLSAQDRLVLAPTHARPEVSSFIELVSVAAHAIDRFERIAHARRNRLAVWGDGNFGYITALLLRAIYPQAEITVLGAVHEKLAYFSFAHRRVHVDHIPFAKHYFDHAFECVGGRGSGCAINQMIDFCAPEATLSLLGVSEQPVEVNTRLVLEKGLRLFGSSRSGVKDFARAVRLCNEHPWVAQALERLVAEVVPVRTIADIHTAFRHDMQQSFGKTVMCFDA
ncbi:MAG: alcohol dehydrogenase catalytic domain-containing protein [Oscillospiraceae bacterium]|nr:alcohol dehydrogenase catalytic domain-containing protein [Oscillospiraceae bacterium]